MFLWPMAFPVDDFLARFKEFSDKEQTVVLNAGQKAMLHIAPPEPGMPLIGPYREYALFLMTAHLLELDDLDDSDNGNTMGGTPFKATVGTVTVENTKQNSFNSDDWNYWLNMTKHGRELLAFLDVQALGIFLNTPNDSVRDLA